MIDWIGLHKATYIGQLGIYKHQEYTINITEHAGRIGVRRKCGAGQVWYNDKKEFEMNWSKLRQV